MSNHLSKVGENILVLYNYFVRNNCFDNTQCNDVNISLISFRSSGAIALIISIPKSLIFLSISSSFKTKNNNDIRLKKPKTKKSLKPLRNNPNINHDNSNYIDIKKGDIIIHNRFGRGEVVQTDGLGSDKKAEVEFETSGIKKILLKFYYAQ